MATTTPATITTREDAMRVYHVTSEQLSRCAMIEQQSPTHEVFFLVQSATLSDVEYKVLYNREHGGLQCTTWNDGPPCLASTKGIPCWHKRAAVCAWTLYKLEQRQQRLNEQAEIEATDEYRCEQGMLTAMQEVIDDAERSLVSAEPDAREAATFTREADTREARAVERHGLNAYQPTEIRRDEQGRVLR